MVETVLIDSVGPAFEFIEEGLISFFIAVLHNIYINFLLSQTHHYFILPYCNTVFITPTQKDAKDHGISMISMDPV